VITGNNDYCADELFRNIACNRGCDPRSGTPVEVTSGSSTRAIDFQLRMLGRIQGTVLAAGLPAQEAYVYVRSDDGDTHSYGYIDDESGHHTVYGLDTGTYHVLARSWSHFVDELYDSIPCPG
jgi:hypothetical protein